MYYANIFIWHANTRGYILKQLLTVTVGGGGSERRGGINMAVSGDVTAIFKGKTVSQLYCANSLES